MRTSWMMIVACLAAFSGCTRGPTTANQPATSVDQPNVDTDSPEPASAIIQANYEAAGDGSAAGPRVIIQVKRVEWRVPATTTAAAMLKQFWSDLESTQGVEAHSDVIATQAVSSLIQSLEAQGLTRVESQPPIVVAEQQTGNWSDAGNWSVTPTGNADDSIHLVLSGSIPNPTASAAQAVLWSASAAADVRPGETLVIEGNAYNVGVIEVSMTPYVGELPIIGQFFRQTKSSLELSQAMYLVTAERADKAAEAK